MNSLFISVLTVLCLGVSSCATLTPKEYKFDKTKQVSRPQQQVLELLYAWCATNEFTIEASSPGILYATSDLTKIQGTEFSGWSGTSAKTLCADCGSNMNGPFVSKSGKLNIIVTRVDDKTTSVMVNFTAKPAEGTLASGCASTGKVESMIFEALK